MVADVSRVPEELRSILTHKKNGSVGVVVGIW